VGHGLIDVFAFQEALVIEAIFTLVILAMIWAGFRRWIQYKEKLGKLIADETAERAAQYGAHMERVEARVKALEEGVTGADLPPQLDAPPAGEGPDPISKPLEPRP
jgi:hypothetical protein